MEIIVYDTKVIISRAELKALHKLLDSIPIGFYTDKKALIYRLEGKAFEVRERDLLYKILQKILLNLCDKLESD